MEDKVGGLDINPTMRGAFLEMAFELKLKEKCNFRSVGKRKEYCTGGESWRPISFLAVLSCSC